MPITVIKFGGEIIDSPEQLENLAISIAELHQQREQIVLVHGGGPQATALTKRLGLIPQMVGGRRVTDAATLEVMKMVLPGVVNSNILALLSKHRLPGASVSGITTVLATRRPPKAVSGSGGAVVDFGLVGDISDINTTLISHLLHGDYIPVVAPLSASSEGQILNINADTVAVKIAQKLRAQRFVAVTSVGGVYQNLEDKSSRLSKLTLAEAKQLISRGVIQGGMIPKLEEGFSLLQEQLDSFHIVGLDSATSIASELLSPGSIGTAVVKS